MSNKRILPRTLEALTHDEGMKDCFVATSTAIHTIDIGDGRHFAAMVFNQVGCPIGAIVVLDRAEIEAQIALLQNAIEDAERLDRGRPPKHAAASLNRH